MAEARAFPEGGYRFLKAGYQFSSGVAAEPGFEIERARLARPLPLAVALRVVEAHLARLGRPTTAFAACELRSPRPFSEQGFDDFNRDYVKTLERWGLYRNGTNPVARTNVSPLYNPPAEPVLHAFSYTAESRGGRGGFIVAGGAEVRGGVEGYAARTVRYGETSLEAMRDKVRHVVGLMSARLEALGFSWADATSVQAYTVHDIGALLGSEIAARSGHEAVAWHLARPPVLGLEFEMDVRGAAREIVL